MLAIRKTCSMNAPHIGTQAGTRRPSMALELTILVADHDRHRAAGRPGARAHPRRERDPRADGADGWPRCRGVSGGGLFLICSSTYGQGDVPDNAKNLYESLKSARPDLSNVQYGVIALGDRTYAETFCNGGKRFDAILSELGARRIGEIMLHDASAGTMPEEIAVQWAGEWIFAVRKEAKLAA